MLQKVATTGVDLDSAYTQTLQRIRAQEGDRSRLGMEVLMWVSHAERPLGINELRHALAVEMGSTDLDPDNIPPQDTVLGSCLGLAVVDAETSTVRLIHYTLQEYLSLPDILPDAHKTLGQTCLTYLNYKQVKELSANPKMIPNFEDMLFLEYSSLYWGSHAKVELSDRAKLLALELLNQAGNHISATLLVKQKEPHHFCSLPYHLWPGLHCASYFGIIEVVAALIESRSCNINQTDCMGLTPLMYAARQGNEEVAQLLLTRDDINPDMPDNNNLTPLWWVSCRGHEGVAGLLLARDDINPEKPDNDGRTLFSWASGNGNMRVAMLLLARDDINPDKPDNDGQTPLSRASYHEHEGVVKLLLARDDVNPNKVNKFGATPLSWASQGGHEGVVKLLLTRDDINPNMPKYLGKTPLWWASYKAHRGVVRLLAHKDVDPNSIYQTRSRSHLSCALGR